MTSRRQRKPARNGGHRVEAEPASGRRSAKFNAWITVAVAIATLLAYVPALRAPFVIDDWVTVDAASRWEATPGMPTAGRPLSMATLAANFQANRLLGVDQRPDPDGPNKTIGYRLFNILLHLSTGALLFVVLVRAMTERSIPQEWRDSAEILAGAVTTIWLLHPIQSEVINYVVQRDEGLASFFYLAVLYASQRAWDAAAPTRWRWYLLAAAACALGMVSKEIVFTAPLAVMLYDRAFRVTSWRALLESRDGRRWLYVILWSICAGGLGVLESGARGDTSNLGVSMTWYAYFYTQCWAIGHYLWLIVWPRALSLDYGFRPVRDASGVPGLLLLSAFAVATILAWRRTARFGWFAFLGSMFFIILAPSSSFVPVALEVAAERRVYLALAPLLVLVVVGVEWVRRKVAPRASPRGIAAGFVFTAALLAFTTAARSRLYDNPEELWRRAALAVPRNSRVYEQLGLALFAQKPPKYAQAESAFTKALAIDTSCQSGCLQYGTMLSKEGRFADAIPLLERQAVQANGTKYNLLATKLVALDYIKLGDYRHAIPHLERLVQMEPTLSHFVALGVAYLSEGRRDEATATFRHLVTYDAGNPELQRLGKRLEGGVNHPEALANLQEFALSMTKGWM